jgi:hypothetical protein
MAEGSGWLELSPIEFARWRWSLYVESLYVDAQGSAVEQQILLNLSKEADAAVHQRVPVIPQFCKEERITWDPLRMDSTIQLTYGKGKDGYFDSEKFIVQFQKALQIGAIKRPNCQIVHLIDHSGSPLLYLLFPLFSPLSFLSSLLSPQVAMMLRQKMPWM